MTKYQGFPARPAGFRASSSVIVGHLAAFGQSLRRVSPEQAFKMFSLVPIEVFTLRQCMVPRSRFGESQAFLS